MPILTGITLECDFCGADYGPEENPKPAGWLRLKPKADIGSTVERVLCPRCTAKVKELADKMELTRKQYEDEVRRAIR